MLPKLASNRKSVFQIRHSKGLVERHLFKSTAGPDRVKTQDREVAIIETGITMLTF